MPPLISFQQQSLIDSAEFSSATSCVSYFWPFNVTLEFKHLKANAGNKLVMANKYNSTFSIIYSVRRKNSLEEIPPSEQDNFCTQIILFCNLDYNTKYSPTTTRENKKKAKQIIQLKDGK